MGSSAFLRSIVQESSQVKGKFGNGHALMHIFSGFTFGIGG